MSEPSQEQQAAQVVEAELQEAIAHTKCHRCGCFQDAVNALDQSAALAALLPGLFGEAKARFEARRYDCLGCEVCWPALASNAATEIDPTLADAGHCATAEPVLRDGWPPLPGDYKVLRHRAPVAVCTLNADDLVGRLALAGPAGMAIVGTMRTENLGIEHLIRNLLPNPNIRFLLLCGDDTRKAIGHLPGQSLISLMRHGLDEHGRIRDAAGKRPVIRNVAPEHVEAFRRRVGIIDLIGETNVEAITEAIAQAAARDPGPDTTFLPEGHHFEAEHATEATRLVSDPAGYLVIYPDRQRRQLVLEHYDNTGVLTRILQGETPAALYGTVIAARLISRLDHAAYLGRELARAEAALRDDTEYTQDKAPGASEPAEAEPPTPSCGCSSCH
ncbi:MAG: DUF4346 domain-containing protein [Rhodocyclaceae bacterium]|nr:DUF4346 domain-containing protein [Rhodocyclaceae bacterium]